MSKPIKWGIIATGRIARKMAHDLKSIDDAQLVAVASRRKGSAEAFAAEYEVPRAYGTYNGVANDPDVDVVYIATPNDMHAANIRACLEAGKAVLCEKPFTLNAKQAMPLIDLAEKKGIFLMEAMWSRFIPAHRKLHELVWTGAFGEIRMVQADFGFRAEFDAENRIFSPKRGGGALLDVGIYPIALAVKLLGIPDRVTGFAQLTVTGVDEQSGIVLGFPGGGIATLTCATRTQTFNEARIYGTKGRARLHEPFWKATELTTFFENQEQHYAIPREEWGYQHQIEEVHRCLRAGEIQSPGMPHDDTLTVLRIMDELRKQWGIKFPGE